MATRRGNHEGSITRRPDGLWEARITIEGGKRKSFYAKTRREVSRRLATAQRDRDTGVPIVGGKQTVAAYLTDWLATTKPTIRPRTGRRYEQLVRVHIVPTLGKVVLSKLTAQQVQALYAKKLQEDLSPTTVHHLHAVLHRALDKAVRLGIVQRNVRDMVDVPRMAHHEMRTLDEEQSRMFIAAASGERLEALFVLAIATGMRQGELLALRWRDVDLENATLRVTATLHYVAGQFIFAEPKTDFSRRQIALAGIAVDALRAHRARQDEERVRLGEAWEDLDLVFPNTVGRPSDGLNLLKYWYHPLLKKAGLPKIRFHDLRHTAATLLLGRGINPKVVSEMLATRTSRSRLAFTAMSRRTCSSRRQVLWTRRWDGSIAKELAVNGPRRTAEVAL
jgi:integrase